MAAIEPGKIRNVAVVGHRGTGKTSLVEALLYQTDEINRLGVVDAGTTVGDWDEDEQKRRMSISLTLAHTEWQGRKINLLDVPGDPSFQGEVRSALRVVEATRADGNILFKWSSVGGIRYRIQYADEINGEFADIVRDAVRETDDSPYGQASTQSFTDTFDPTAVGRYYRIKVVP